MRLLYGCSEVALRLLSGCSEVALRLLSGCSLVALKLLSDCCRVALRLARRLWLCSHSEMARMLLSRCANSQICSEDFCGSVCFFGGERSKKNSRGTKTNNFET